MVFGSLPRTDSTRPSSAMSAPSDIPSSEDRWRGFNRNLLNTNKDVSLERDVQEKKPEQQASQHAWEPWTGLTKVLLSAGETENLSWA